MLSNLKIKKIIQCVTGSAILAFGFYNVHALSNVTEGGILGATLLLHHWLNVSPALSGLLMNAVCYVLGWRLFGRGFIAYSIISAVSFSAFYMVFESFPPLWPALADMPLLAALLGALFVGLGVGLCMRSGGAPGGDDALAMVINKVTKLDIRWAYLACDLIVLLLSLSYLDPRRLAYSLLTVILSGQLIGAVQDLSLDGAAHKADAGRSVG